VDILINNAGLALFGPDRTARGRSVRRDVRGAMFARRFFSSRSWHRAWSPAKRKHHQHREHVR